MGKQIVLGFLLLAAIACQQTVTAISVLQDGDTYRLPCRLSTSSNDPDIIVQFIREKTEVKMFNSRSSTATVRIISNDTDLDPLITNKTDRYSVVKSGERYEFVIQNVHESDSGHYACRLYDTGDDSVRASIGSEELLIRGPLRGVYWTGNFSGLDTSRASEVEDGATALVHNYWHGPDMACAVEVSNVEPEVNITIGKLGAEGTEDITDQFETRIASAVSIDDVGTLYRATVFFVKKFKFSQTSIRDLYCHASQPGSAPLERSVNIQVISAPPNKGCQIQTFWATVGSTNVTVGCLVPAHPAPEVTWEILQDDGTRVNETSDNPVYKVTNEERFEGLLTTLTISEVTPRVFGRFSVKATNTEGSGTMYLTLREGTDPNEASGGEMKDPNLRLLMVLGLLLWMLK